MDKRLTESLSAQVTRGAESWQFFAFVFGAALTLAYGVADDLLEGAGWHRHWRIGLRVGLFFALWYMFMRNRWVRHYLVTFLGWTARESERRLTK